jgi:UDP-glucose 4-epimerase
MQHSIITGGAGFIGSHLADLLLEKGHHITLIDNLQTGNLDNIVHLKGNDKCQVLIQDCTETKQWSHLVRENDWIFHLAGSVGVEHVTTEAAYTRSNNVGTMQAILQVAVQKKAQVFVASTSEVYGDRGEALFTETDDCLINVLQKGRSAYTISKLYAELLALEAAEQYGLRVIIGRFFNTTGPRQTATYGMVVPTFVRQVRANQPLTIFGSGTQTRAFAHVTDTVEAICQLSNCTRAVGHIFNIGADKPITINELAHYIAQEHGYTGTINYAAYPAGRAGGSDCMYRCPDLRKIRAFTGFEHRYCWKSAVEAIWSDTAGVAVAEGS